MPGTVVRDSIAPNLLNGVTLTTAAGANQAGTAWEASWPGEVQFTVVLAGKAGTTPVITVRFEGCETSDFSTADVVSLGQVTSTDAANGVTLGLTSYVNSKFVRAVSTVTGTSGAYTGTTATPVLPHDRRTRSVNPTASPLA
jgi:hypothetical protein